MARRQHAGGRWCWRLLRRLGLGIVGELAQRAVRCLARDQSLALLVAQPTEQLVASDRVAKLASLVVSARSTAVKWATLEVASSSTRGRSWDPSGRGPPWECRAARGHQARPKEVQQPSWGTAKGGTLTVL